MSKQNKVIAILSADWHLSHHPPVWRSAEPDWYAAMQRPLEEVSTKQKQREAEIKSIEKKASSVEKKK